MVLVDLREHPYLIRQYVEVRNRYLEELMTYEVTQESTEKWLQDHHGLIMCAVNGFDTDKIYLLGVGIVYTERNNEFAIFTVAPGAGLGGFIIKEMDRFCRRDGIKKVWARVKSGNEIATAFFDKHFTKTGDTWEKEFN